MKSRTLVTLCCSTLLLGSCATPTQTSAPSPLRIAPSVQTLTRRIMATIEDPTGGIVTVKPDAPTQPFEQADKLPGGNAINLDFKASQGQIPAADKIWFEEGKAFELTVSAGADFNVTDSDATDGTASVALPQGAFDAYLSLSGQPGGSVEVTDSLYFLKETLDSTKGKKDWAHLGVRQFPTTRAFKLFINPQGVSSFSSRWYRTDESTVVQPPLPPSITLLSGPDVLNPGATGTIQATVSDPNNDPLTYHWTVINAAGEAVPAPTGESTATWTAPLKAGTYFVSLAVEDAYFITETSKSLPIVVPNLAPSLSLSGKTGTLPTSLNVDTSVDLAATASDPNGDPLTWRWTTTGGTIEGTGSNAHWVAPSTAGTYTVTVFVSDGANEVSTSHTFTVIKPTPTPTPAPTLPPTYGNGTKLRLGLYATTNQTVIFEEFDLSGLPRISGSKALKLGFFEPNLSYDYIYETDNTGKRIGFSWNYLTWGQYGQPKAQNFVYAGDIEEGKTHVLPNFYRVGFPGNSAVLLDANGVPLPKTRANIWSVSYPAGAIVSNVKMLKAVMKVSYPARKYKLYFDDGSVGESDSYNLGKVTGRIVSTSSKGSVVLPVGARFKCGVIDNSNVTADQAFTPVLPPAIQKYF